MEKHWTLYGLTLVLRSVLTWSSNRDFACTGEAMKQERSRICVSVTVFGRVTPIDLEFLQVEAA